MGRGLLLLVRVVLLSLVRLVVIRLIRIRIRRLSRLLSRLWMVIRLMRVLWRSRRLCLMRIRRMDVCG